MLTYMPFSAPMYTHNSYTHTSSPLLAHLTDLRGVLRMTVLCSCLTATLALAQTTTTLTLRVGSNDADTYVIGASDCASKLSVRWKYATAQSIGILCTPLSLWSTSGECSQEPGDDDVRYDDVAAQTLLTAGEGTFDVAISGLPDFAKSDTETPCGSANLHKTHKVCGVIEYAQTSCGISNQPKLRASALTILYDTKPPAAPSVSEVKAFDSKAEIHFTADSETSTVIAEFRKQDSGPFQRGNEVEASAGVIQLDDLQDDTAYDVRLLAKDKAGNLSEASQIVSVTPIQTIGFWSAYRAREAQAASTGCSSAPGLFLPLVGVGYFTRRRLAGCQQSHHRA